MTKDSPRVSCIIPAFNEAVRIGCVLEAVAGHPDVAEVIVVDDASTDATAEIVAAIAATTPGLRLIRQPQNRGKTAALAAGIEAAGAPLLLLLDADLIGLTPAHIAALIAPVRSGRADISISLRDNAPRLWRAIGLDYISGERVLARSLLDQPLEVLLRLPKFGFEVYLNTLCIGRRCRIAVVDWPGVKSPFKQSKYGLLAGLRADARMMGDIFRTVSPARIVAQILAMRAMRVQP